jgi:hypothetical protein
MRRGAEYNAMHSKTNILVFNLTQSLQAKVLKVPQVISRQLVRASYPTLHLYSIILFLCVTSYLNRTISKIFALWDVMQRKFLVSHRRFRKTNRSQFKVLRSPRIRFSWTALPLNMGKIGCSETSVANYQPPLRDIPEERRSHSCFFSYIATNLQIRISLSLKICDSSVFSFLCLEHYVSKSVLLASSGYKNMTRISLGSLY